MVSVINSVVGTSISPSPKICLLGLVEDLVPTVAERTLIGLLLFYAKKAIAPSWKNKKPAFLFLEMAHYLYTEILTTIGVAQSSKITFWQSGWWNSPQRLNSNDLWESTGPFILPFHLVSWEGIGNLGSDFTRCRYALTPPSCTWATPWLLLCFVEHPWLSTTTLGYWWFSWCPCIGYEPDSVLFCCMFVFVVY